MHDATTADVALLALAACAAGAVNAVAGGGTLLTFPALGRVLPLDLANTTSTVALLPGSLAGAWGFRRELGAARWYLVRLVPPSLVGGALGSVLLLLTPQSFGQLVPWLILGTAVLFVLQKPISSWLKRRVKPGAAPSPPTALGVAGLVAAQFAVAVYGGYFGAGIGILMLTLLGFMGIANIHQANGIKTVLAASINVVSAVIFVAQGKVRWEFALVMALASVVGGYGGARLSTRLPSWAVRWGVIAIGFGLAGFYFQQVYAGYG